MNTELAWFTSTYSDGEGGNCVEVAAAPATVHVRDSKDRSGPLLAFAPDAWTAFVAFARTHAV
ncbi:DUF397 domain-containing protein [Streptomyces sp. SL13]|jgi:hypothetical protein|uniref:DUF397 domain-containing protein n=1 Tax=Streptantibioticus silvisoli TaxID=2705255 RepID=A0AA90H6D8_9ACTN|nr:DUF397 domain-containing protein [Streptantibioticus silvisoli]MDI5966133.1 DUF397 domain-containing protein [Streptantibioticus silvisoli]MDI5972756.1 DUF397 domain-containing protein [Streptantibioticus silvisoli]